jgi:hypothetical protein
MPANRTKHLNEMASVMLVAENACRRIVKEEEGYPNAIFEKEGR